MARMTRTTPFAALRRSRVGVVVLALAALLCAQTALAFYRCPQLTTSSVAASDRTPCEQMDLASPALCKAFVQGDAQGLAGKRAALDFAAAAPLGAAMRLSFALPPRTRPAARRAPLRTRPPPLWITFGRHRD
jgi:hypothetical protein